MQEEVDKIMKWADNWKMVINVDKTRTMIISSSNADSNTDPQIGNRHRTAKR